MHKQVGNENSKSLLRLLAHPANFIPNSLLCSLAIYKIFFLRLFCLAPLACLPRSNCRFLLSCYTTASSSTLSDP